MRSEIAGAMSGVSTLDTRSARFLALIRRAADVLGSQASVAKSTGLSPSYVGKVLRGEVGDVKVRKATADAVARALGISMPWISGEPTDPDEWAALALPESSRVVAEATAYDDGEDDGDDDGDDPDSNRRSEGLAALIADVGRTGTRGWKQALAQRIGVSPGYISKFLGKPYPNLSEHTAHQIEMRLGLERDALLNGARALDGYDARDPEDED